MISEQIGLDLLRLFVAVSRQGSLSKVAAETGRTQSALSMQLRRLEALIGKRLFQRTGRGVIPTAEGELLLGYATRMLALGDEAAARLKEKTMSGALRVGLAEEVAHIVLPTALGRLHRAYPEIRLDIVLEHSVALGRLWAKDGLDLLIAPVSVVTGDTRATWQVALQWVSAIDHEPDPTKPLDLVTFVAPCQWRKRMLEALDDIGRKCRVTLTSQSIAALQAAVEAGLGIGALPADSIRTNTMKVLKPAQGLPPPLSVQYGLYAPDRRSKMVDAAIEVLREGLPVA